MVGVEVNMTLRAVRAVRRAALGVTLGVGLVYAAVWAICLPRGRAA
jgi:hypothetical protein